LIFAGVYLQAQDIGTPLLYCIAFTLLWLKRVRIMVELIEVLEEGCLFSQGQTGFSWPGGRL
jgi:hypothetical protein